MKRFLLAAVASLVICSAADAAPTSPAHIFNWVPSEHPATIAEWQAKWANPLLIPPVTIWGTREALKRGELWYIYLQGGPDAATAHRMHQWGFFYGPR